MADIQTHTLSTDGFASKSQVGDYTIDIDATNETGPNPNQVLVADYASCFLPAFRVGGQQAGHDDLGAIQIDAEADLDDETFADITERAEGICHVHTALREGLSADVTVHGGIEIDA